jgi:hypothetical protein
VWHAYLPGASPGSATATGCTGPTTRAGHRCNPNKLLLDPYAKAIDGQIDWDQALFSYDFGDPTSYNDPRLRPAHDEVGRHQPLLRLGPRPPPNHDYHESVIYEAHVKGMTMTHPDVPEEHPRHLRRHGAPGRGRPPRQARRHRGRADAGAPVRQDPTCRTRGCRTTGATTPSASSPRTTPTPPRASAASRCRSSRRWSRPCTPPASRSSSTWSTTTPPRATTSARRCPSGHRQRRLLPPRRRRPAHYYDTPARATACSCATRTCCS